MGIGKIQDQTTQVLEKQRKPKEFLRLALQTPWLQMYGRFLQSDGG